MIGIHLGKEGLVLQKCQSILLGIGLGLGLLGFRTEVMDCLLLCSSKQETSAFEKREIRVGGSE